MNEPITTRKSIAKSQSNAMIQQFGENVRANWIFNKWYEKFILLALLFLGLWKLVNLLMGWFL